MLRFLNVLVLWGLFSIVGLVAVLSCAWVLALEAPDRLTTGFLVLGLASVLPVSLAVADNVVPRDNRSMSPSVPCPHCGAPVGPSLAAKTDPGLWPYI
jgi:hypothetical protein